MRKKQARQKQKETERKMAARMFGLHEDDHSVPLALTKPDGRFWGGLIHDLGSDRYVLFGGHDDGVLGNRNDLWAFDVVARTWREVQAESSPQAVLLGVTVTICWGSLLFEVEATKLSFWLRLSLSRRQKTDSWQLEPFCP